MSVSTLDSSYKKASGLYDTLNESTNRLEPTSGSMEYTMQPDSTIRRRYLVSVPEDVNHYRNDGDAHLAVCDGPADDVDSDGSHPQEKIIFPKVRKNKFPFLRTLTWWDDEYKCLAICVFSIIILAIVLWYFDGKQPPELAPGVQLDMIIIALVTTSRVAMGSVVEACISQCAWIWIAKTHQVRTQTHARLKDFKLFDEAARGLLGSLALIWRLKGTHLACIGAFIVVVTHGFETFSQQMFDYIQKPATYTNETMRPAPMPPRSEHWDNIVHRGVSLNFSLPLSTKAAIYSGILSTEIREIEPHCLTGNCSWPVVPTLAVCGECMQKDPEKTCDRSTKRCTFSREDISVSVSEDRETDACQVHSKSYPSNDTDWNNRTFLSVFELLVASSRPPRLNATFAECALWICMKAIDLEVIDGKLYHRNVFVWNTTSLENETSAHVKEHVFVDVPSEMNIQARSRYSVSDRSVDTIRTFMDFLLEGTYEKSFEVVNFSSDWVEALWLSAPDVQMWMNRLSQSLSNEFRRHGIVRNAHQTAYEGEATKMVNFVHVKWVWIVYQPLFLFLTIYFFITTVLAARRDDVAVWKNDSMPMLFTRIHPDILSLGVEKMDTHKGLDDLGKHGVALTKDEDGCWSFEPTDHPIQHHQRFGALLRATGVHRW